MLPNTEHDRDDILKNPERLAELAIIKPMLNQYMGEKFAPDSDLLLSIFGKNIVGNIYGPGIGFNIGLSVHDHSCVPSAFITLDGPKAVLRSPKKEQKYSKDLTVSFVDLLTPHEYRKWYLRSMYYFDSTCSRCSDPTFVRTVHVLKLSLTFRDFMCNSAYAACCPYSYCPLDPNGKELTCFNCGTVSGTSVKEAIAANTEIIPICDRIRDENAQESDKSKYVQSLVKLYDKFSKILSTFNVQLLLINDRLFGNAIGLGDRRVCGKYAPLLLPAYRRYLPVGHPELSLRLKQIVTAVSKPRTSERDESNCRKGLLGSFFHSHGNERIKLLTAAGDDVLKMAAFLFVTASVMMLLNHASLFSIARILLAFLERGCLVLSHCSSHFLLARLRVVHSC